VNQACNNPSSKTAKIVMQMMQTHIAENIIGIKPSAGLANKL
jgi:hypothetical protein